MVGRAGELRALRAALDQARGGRSTAVAVVGEPGIGKTTMLDSLCTWARSAKFAVFAGGGSELEQDVPFGLVIDALDEPLGQLRQDALKWLGSETVAEIGSVLPAFAERGVETRRAVDTERYRSHDAVRDLLEHVARERPVLLALDDVHWADPASAELMSHLLRRPMRRSMLAVAYRPHAAPSRLLAAIDAVARRDTLPVLELGPFTIEEAGELLGRGRARQTVEALYAQSGGNPFYLEQLARVERTSGAPLSGAPSADGERDVPPAVRAALAQELRTLTPRCLRLLEAASVIGDPFDLDLAAEIATLDEPSALAALDEFAATGLVRETSLPRRLRFRHPIVRRSVYDGTRAGWRLDAHRRAARALARRDSPIGAVAHHVERSAKAGDEEAARLLADAGYAAASHAPAAAIHWFGAALRLMGHAAPAERRLPLLLARAAALATTGRMRESGDVLAGVLALVPPEEPEARARVMAMIARIEQGLGRGTRARRLLAQALAGVDPASADAVTLRLELSENHMMMREWGAARAEAEAAHELARSVGDRALRLSAVMQIGWSGQGSDTVSASRERCAEAARGIDELGDEELTPQLLEALLRLGYTEISSDRLADAARHLERGERACRATGHGHLLVGMLAGQAAARRYQGRLTEARQAAEAATEASLLLENDQSLALAESLRCMVAALQGERDTALTAGQVGIQAAERAPASMFAWLPPFCYGEALIVLGRHEEGRTAMLAAGGTELSDVLPASRPHWWRLLVECDVKAGRLDAARVLTERLERLADTPSRMGEARLARAMLLLAREDWHEAARVAREAAGYYAAAGWSIEAARSGVAAASALERTGDTAACRHELESAHAVLRSCGARRLADQAARRLRELGLPVTLGTSPSASDHPDGPRLSVREAEVADRVSRGYTNRQIADELFISEKTVEKHLAHVFAKLGVSSRAAVAATIARRQEGGLP